jgi:hypothetical protein
MNDWFINLQISYETSYHLLNLYEENLIRNEHEKYIRNIYNPGKFDQIYPT